MSNETDPNPGVIGDGTSNVPADAATRLSAPWNTRIR